MKKYTKEEIKKMKGIKKRLLERIYLELYMNAVVYKKEAVCSGCIEISKEELEEFKKIASKLVLTYEIAKKEDCYELYIYALVDSVKGLVNPHLTFHIYKFLEVKEVEICDFTKEDLEAYHNGEAAIFKNVTRI